MSNRHMAVRKACAAFCVASVCFGAAALTWFVTREPSGAPIQVRVDSNTAEVLETLVINGQPNFDIGWLQVEGAEKAAVDIFRLGLSAEFGRGDSGKYARALALYRRAGELGCREARIRESLLTFLGIGMQSDRTAALAIWKSAFEGGYPAACYAIPTFFDSTDGVEVIEIRKRLEALSSNVGPIRFAASYALGELMSHDENVGKAIYYLTRASRGKVRIADLALARLCAEGKYLPTQSEDQAYLQTLAAILGYRFSRPGGLPPMTARAADLLETLREGEYWGGARCSLAITVLGFQKASEDARGLDVVADQAARACMLGASEACLYAALVFTEKNDLRERDHWIAKGLALGDWRCQYTIELNKGGFLLSEAMERAAISNRDDYSSYIERMAPKSGYSPAQPLSIEMPRLHGTTAQNQQRQLAVVKGIVGIDGRLVMIQVEGCDSQADVELLKEAARAWKFRPGMKDGHAVIQHITMPIFGGRDL